MSVININTNNANAHAMNIEEHIKKAQSKINTCSLKDEEENPAVIIYRKGSVKVNDRNSTISVAADPTKVKESSKVQREASEIKKKKHKKHKKDKKRRKDKSSKG